jgi:hypothetical protein
MLDVIAIEHRAGLPSANLQHESFIDAGREQVDRRGAPAVVDVDALPFPRFLIPRSKLCLRNRLRPFRPIVRRIEDHSFRITEIFLLISRPLLVERIRDRLELRTGQDDKQRLPCLHDLAGKTYLRAILVDHPPRDFLKGAEPAPRGVHELEKVLQIFRRCFLIPAKSAGSMYVPAGSESFGIGKGEIRVRFPLALPYLIYYH